MSKLEDARKILTALQVPKAQKKDMCCYTLLALAGLDEDGAWDSATNEWIRIHDVNVFLKEHYDVAYAENSRETIRKDAMHHFRNAAFIEDNGMPTNSPKYCYRLTNEMVELVRSYGSDMWERGS